MSVVAAAVVGSAVVGAVASKNNADRAAKAQGDIAYAQLEQQQRDRAEALKYAEASPQELEQLQRSIALNETDIGRKEKLLASSDPAVIEAGQQALQLLRGEEAKTLGPLKNNIAKQEQALRQKLQAQLGPGYENTTAGIQALQAFNEQSSNALANAQQGSLAQLLGVAQDTSGRYGMQSNIANAGTVGQAYGNISGRKASAMAGTPISGAGAQFVGDLQSARGDQQTLGTLLQVAGTGASLYSGGAFDTKNKSDYSTVSSPTAGNSMDGTYSLNSGAGVNVSQYK